MASSTIASIKEQYLNLCQEQSVEPHKFVFSALQKSAKNYMLDPENKIHIDLSGNSYKCSGPQRLPDKDIEIICSALVDCTILTSLDLKYCNLTNHAINAIATLIQASFSLEELNLMCNNITAEGAHCIANALVYTKVLKDLKLNGNKIGDKGAMHVAFALTKNKTLEKLDLGDCDIEIDSIIAICTALHRNITLKALNLSRPVLFSVQEESAVHIGEMLKENMTLEELHLEKFLMTDFGVERLCEGLMNNKSLTYLNLSCNKITRDGALALSKLLRFNQTLTVLNLAYNRIESPGAIYFSEVLRGANRSINTLVLTSNQIKGDGLVAIASAIESNWYFTNVYIWGNYIDDEASTAFGNLIHNKKLRLSNTDVKPYVVDGQTYLAELSHGIKRLYYWQPCYGLNYVGDSDEEADHSEKWLF